MQIRNAISARECRIIWKMCVGQNLGNVIGDSWDRYVKTPVESGAPERLLVTAPIGVLNTIGRSIDAILAGAVGQPLSVPDGSMAETRRDVQLASKHILPPKPLKLITDAIRAPGAVTSGILDLAIGSENRHGTLTT